MPRIPASNSTMTKPDHPARLQEVRQAFQSLLANDTVDTLTSALSGQMAPSSVMEPLRTRANKSFNLVFTKAVVARQQKTAELYQSQQAPRVRQANPKHTDFAIAQLAVIAGRVRGGSSRAKLIGGVDRWFPS